MPNAWQSLGSPSSSSSSDSADSPSPDPHNNNNSNNIHSEDIIIINNDHDHSNASTSRNLTRIGSGSGSGSGSSTGTGSDALTRSKERVKPLSRRGHFKSRLGCFNCKRRRVKCNEIRPACSPCCRLGLTCNYPSPGLSSMGAPSSSSSASASASSSSSSSSASATMTPRAALPMLAMEDLRFYHQFLTVAYPTLPLKALDVWMQAGAMSHSYEHLTHAVLGLGATHLSAHGHVNYTESALQHRVTAMKLANEQLARTPKNVAEADALFATLACLVAQSSLMPSGLVDYLTITRGAFLVLTTVLPQYKDSIFRCLALDENAKTVIGLASEHPKDIALLDDFQAAIVAMEPMCQTPVEKSYHAGLIRCVDSVFISAAQAWLDYVAIFLKPSTLTNQEYLDFIHPDNHIGYLLIIHCLLLDYVLGRFCIARSEMPKLTGRKTNVIHWSRNLADTLPLTYKPFMRWALEFCDDLERSDGRYLLSP